MQRISSYLEDDFVDKIKKLYQYSNISLSKMTSELIDIGYRVKLHHEMQPNSQEAKKAVLVDKHTEYLLKIMTIVSDVYRCVRNEKSKYYENTADEALATIYARVLGFISQRLEESGNEQNDDA